MMANLIDVMVYIISNYPEKLKHELSNARLTKMIYLADWHSAINEGKQITDIDWYFDNYGPFVADVENMAVICDEIFSINVGTNMYGQTKKTIALKTANYRLDLTEKEERSLDHIIDICKTMYWDQFIKLIYSTHPIASSERYNHLNLIEKAKEYKRGDYRVAS
jgi:hypothetical protein